MEQAKALQSADCVGPIEAIDVELAKLLTPTEMSDPEFKFKVNYSLEKSSKGDSHFTFSNNIEGTSAHNVLVQKVASDEDWPHKPSAVVKLVKEKTGIPFSSHNHTQAWRKLGVRPRSGSKNPGATNPKYCTFHAAHNDYTYSDEWINELCKIVKDQASYSALRAYRLIK
jgi:hypothetical protein